MPDPEGRRVLPGDVFEQQMAALGATRIVPVKGGGIITSDKYKSYVVNIRPTKWLERFWIGKINDYVDAQFIADAVFHYIGHPSFHFKDANFNFSPLECIDRGISTFLTDREMCSKYTSSIAKGNEFKTQRSDFKKKVKTLALEELKSPGVQSVLRQFRHKSSSAVSPVEKVAGNDVDGIDAEHSTPMEVDDLSQQATNFSRLVTSCCDEPEAVDQNLESRNGLVPSFDISGPGFTLQSDFTPVEFSWTEDYLDSLNYSDLEDLHESFNNDNSSNPLDSSFVYEENFRVNFFAAMEDAGVDSTW